MHIISRTVAVAALLVTPLAGAQELSNAFNPKISLILQGQFADFSLDSEPEVPGVLLGPETEFKPAGAAIGEAELTLEANVDDAWRGWATIAVENEDGETVVAVEEMYLNSLALPHGLQVKFGRFFSDLGYHNAQHSHAWDFVDAPLAYRALLANTYGDDGLQLRWLAPTPLLVEFGIEALRGAGFPGGGEGRDGINALVGFANIGGDVGTGGAWQLGLSHLATDALERAGGEEDGPSALFTGDSDLTAIDFVYKWAPNGNPVERNFKLQAEYLLRSEDGEIDDSGTVAAYDGDQSGFYIQAVYQFMRAWRIGARYGLLDIDNTVSNTSTGALANLANAADDTPSRSSVMIDWSRSEFSRIRLQFNRDESRPGEEADDQVFLQYVFSLGAHPAHQF